MRSHRAGWWPSICPRCVDKLGINDAPWEPRYPDTFPATLLKPAGVCYTWNQPKLVLVPAASSCRIMKCFGSAPAALGVFIQRRWFQLLAGARIKIRHGHACLVLSPAGHTTGARPMAPVQGMCRSGLKKRRACKPQAMYLYHHLLPVPSPSHAESLQLKMNPGLLFISNSWTRDTLSGLLNKALG